MFKQFFYISIVMITGCAAISTGLNKLNTNAKGATAIPTTSNLFQGSFEYHSFDYLKQQLNSQTKFWASYFRDKPYLSKSKAEAKIAELPKGGILTIEHINKEGYISGGRIIEITTIDTIRIFSLSDTTIEFPTLTKRYKNDWPPSNVNNVRWYDTGVNSAINATLPDSFLVKCWIRYRDNTTDTNFVNSWKVFLNNK